MHRYSFVDSSKPRCSRDRPLLHSAGVWLLASAALWAPPLVWLLS
jgi:hypothetical protein